ncbi:MAG TPA: AmmeMemoRadiSam system protein B, partial [Anaerolineae bacterium]|nr:AmmeMemoRadiSam system protein B [Anaerolineae bacterium]
MPDARTIRHSIIAGQWYPGEPRQLRAMMDGFMAAVDTEPLQGELVGLIVPHAGYMYSGQ